MERFWPLERIRSGASIRTWVALVTAIGIGCLTISSALASNRNSRMMVVQSWNGYGADTSSAVSYYFQSPNTAGNLLIACMVTAAPFIRMEDNAGNQYLLAASYKIPASGGYFDNYY